MRLAHFLLALGLGWLGQTWTTAATLAHISGNEDEDRRMYDAQRELAFDARRAIDEAAAGARDAARTDEAKTDATRLDMAKTDAVKTDALKIEALKIDAVKIDAAETDATRTDALKTETVVAVAVPTPLKLVSGDAAPVEPYMDAYRILKASNPCSDFFGGSAQAIEALNDLAAQLRSKPFGNSFIAIRMSGSYTRKRNATTGARYRIFDEATVNSLSPFYNAALHQGAKLLSFGRFPAHTRRARVLVLLHELGHLVVGADGLWLLPNDGTSHAQSVRNTELVERRCLKQLLEIEK